MLINYYKQHTNNIDNLHESSPYAKNHKFELAVDMESARASGASISVITGIVEKVPQISYSTKWDNSPVSKVTDLVKKFTEHKLIKQFGQTNAGYIPPIVTDGWTQQIPSTAEPLSFDLEFKSYSTPILETSPYSEVINFLIFITTPRKYNISNSIEYFKSAIEKAKDGAKKVAPFISDVVGELSENKFKMEDIDLKGIMNVMKDSSGNFKTEINPSDFNSLTGETRKMASRLKDVLDLINGAGVMDEHSGGCPLVFFNYNTVWGANDPDSNILNMEGFNKIPFIVKSWSFKPAINVEYDVGTEKYQPIYIDFKISLESQYVLTNNDLIKNIKQN